MEQRTRVKCILDCSGHAIYFSRGPLPANKDGCVRNFPPPFAGQPYLLHLGLACFDRAFLAQYCRMPPTPLMVCLRTHCVQLCPAWLCAVWLWGMLCFVPSKFLAQSCRMPPTPFIVCMPIRMRTGSQNVLLYGAVRSGQVCSVLFCFLLFFLFSVLICSVPLSWPALSFQSTLYASCMHSVEVRHMLQLMEDLEQLKVLENGYKIKVIVVDHKAHGVDEPEDVAVIEQKMRKAGLV